MLNRIAITGYQAQRGDCARPGGSVSHHNCLQRSILAVAWFLARAIRFRVGTTKHDVYGTSVCFLNVCAALQRCHQGVKPLIIVRDQVLCDNYCPWHPFHFEIFT